MKQLLILLVSLILPSMCAGQEFPDCQFGSWKYFGGRDEKAFLTLVSQLADTIGKDISAKIIKPTASDAIQIQTIQGIINVDSVKLKDTEQVYFKTLFEKKELEEILGKNSRKELLKLGFVPVFSMPKIGEYPIRIYSIQSNNKPDSVIVYRLWNGKYGNSCSLHIIVVFGNIFTEHPDFIAYREASPK